MSDIVARKTCRRCGETKDLSEFYKRTKSKDGRYRTCKSCMKNKNSDYYQNHVEWYAQYFQRRIKEIPKETYREKQVASHYKISVEEYRKLIERSKGVCEACGHPQPSLSLAVDHDHKTGKVRGLLCRRCNLALGFVKDNPQVLFKLYRYLASN
jgi:hypothetical protein